MEATGTIIAVFPIASGKSQRTGNTWHNQEYVLQTEEQYPKKIPFEVFSEERINRFAIRQGERLTIHFDIDANEYQGKYYTKIRCYNVTRQQASQPAQAAPSPAFPPAASPAASPVPYAATASQPQPAQPSLFPPQQPAQTNTDDLPF